MKTKLQPRFASLFALLCVASTLFLLSSCSNRVEYVPCIAEDGEDWGFVDANGNVYLQDEYANCPSVVVDGVFTVRNKKTDLYTLCSFDEKKPKVILKNLKYVGFLSDGLIPVCKQGDGITVVDKKGNTKFKLDKVNGAKVVSCYPGFVDGLLVVNLDNDLCAAYNEKGEVVIKPKYSSMVVLGNNMIGAWQTDGSEIYVDYEGKKLKQWKDDYENLTVYSNVVTYSKDDRVYIADFDGNKILKCPSDVQRIKEVDGKRFIFVDEDGEYGMMDFDGEELIKSKYSTMTFGNGDVYAKKEYDGEILKLSNSGEVEEEYSDVDGISYIKGFGFIGWEETKHGTEYTILKSNLERANDDQELYNIDLFRGFSDKVYSDKAEESDSSSYYDEYEAVADSTAAQVVEEAYEAAAAVAEASSSYNSSYSNYADYAETVSAASDAYVAAEEAAVDYSDYYNY